MATAAAVFSTARTLLNDDAATLWTDAVLLPKLQEAHRELQVRLNLCGIPVIRAVTAVLTVTAGIKNLGTDQPADLIKPEWLKERAVGQQERDFVDMTEVDYLPELNQTTELIYWSWYQEKVTFIGATTTREVKLRYWRGVAVPTSGTSVIGFIFGENYLGHRTAALAASSVGQQTSYQEWTAEANAKLDEIIRMNIKGMQNLPARRRPYHRRHNRVLGRF